MVRLASQGLSAWLRVSLVIASLGVLLAVYMFQRTNWAAFPENVFGSSFHPYLVFVINKTVRLVLNDMACLMLIYALFRERKYVKLAFLLFLTEIFIILPLYLVVKLTLEGDSEISSPLLSQVHRLIVNPTLMLLLMLGFYYQKYIGKRSATN